MDRKSIAGVLAALAAAGGLVWLYRRAVDSYYRLQGCKTYLIAGAYMGHAVLGWWLGDLDVRQAADRVLEGMAGMSMRAGMSKSARHAAVQAVLSIVNQQSDPVTPAAPALPPPSSSASAAQPQATTPVTPSIAHISDWPTTSLVTTVTSIDCGDTP